jgi:hypothetical protein
MPAAGLEISNLLNTRTVDVEMVDELTREFSAIPAVVGAVLMGSRSRGYAHRNSNADVILVVDELATSTVDAIQAARDHAQRALGYPISVNCHTLRDADPLLARDNLFMHKNRAELYILQASHTAIPLFGRNVFAEFPVPDPSQVRSEAVRVVASFLYLLRKFLFDETLAPHGRAEFVRGPLICLEYVAAFYGFLALGWRDALDHLADRKRLPRETVAFLEHLGRRKAESTYDDLTIADVVRGIGLMEEIHQQLVYEYRNSGRTDVRWVGQRVIRHWDLAAPRVGMVLVRNGKLVLSRDDSRGAIGVVRTFIESENLGISAAKFSAPYGSSGRISPSMPDPVTVRDGAYFLCDAGDGSLSGLECLEPHAVLGQSDLDPESREIVEALLPRITK